MRQGVAEYVNASTLFARKGIQMPYFDFLWPVSAIEHIAEHGITPEEFEDVVLHAERRGESRSSRRPCCWGETRDGRYLFLRSPSPIVGENDA